MEKIVLTKLWIKTFLGFDALWLDTLRTGCVLELQTNFIHPPEKQL